MTSAPGRHDVFVYKTLKRQHVRTQALGHKMPDGPATALLGYMEVERAGWPTLEVASGRRVTGELLEVSDSDLIKLDEWEFRYRRIRVLTLAGPAWAYVLR